MQNTQDIFAKLNTTLKAITTGSMGSGLLTEEKANQFIRVAENATPLMSAARRLPMNSHTRDIDRIQFGGRILQKTGGETTAISNEQGVTTFMNQLVSQELGGYAGITDQTLEDNIERQGLENTVIQLLGEAVGRDLEHLALSGDTTLADNLLNTTDGWLKKSANTVTGAAAPTGSQFLNTDVEKMLDALLLAVPKKYMTNLGEWKFYAPWEIINDYRDKLRVRETSLGDAAVTSANALSYKGITLEYVPQMPVDKMLLAPANNLVYGIYREVRIEPDRIPKSRRTDFVVTCRFDCHYEDENASAVATGYAGPA